MAMDRKIVEIANWVENNAVTRVSLVYPDVIAEYDGGAENNSGTCRHLRKQKFPYPDAIVAYDCVELENEIWACYRLLTQKRVYRSFAMKVVCMLAIYLNDPKVVLGERFVEYVWKHDDTMKRSRICDSVDIIHKTLDIGEIGMLTKRAQ